MGKVSGCDQRPFQTKRRRVTRTPGAALFFFFIFRAPDILRPPGGNFRISPIVSENFRLCFFTRDFFGKVSPKNKGEFRKTRPGSDEFATIYFARR
jgi:hypothetical protein